MVIETFRSITQHLRIGYVSGLIVIDLLCLSLFVIDVINYDSMGLNFRLAYKLIPGLFRLSIWSCFAILVLGIIVIPIAVAIVRIIAGTGPRLSRALVVRKLYISVIHIFSVLLIVFCFLLATSMQIVSGFRLTVEGMSFRFESFLYGAMTSTAANVLLLLSTILILFSRVVFVWIFERKKPLLLQEYAARLALADLGGQMYPESSRYYLNFNAAAAAPAIRSVKKHAQVIANTYQHKIPGTVDASRYLWDIANECKSLLHEILLERSEHKKYEIEFFSGTSRAMEVALTRIMRSKQIILSPFEHPSEEKVAHWRNIASGISIHPIRFEASDFLQNWSVQEHKFVELLLSQIASRKGLSVLLLSEVCHATGLVIPVDKVIDKVREKYGSDRLRIIIDGAHAIGNIAEPQGFKNCDAYVFSAHKWLFAPEPSGILLTLRTSSPLQSTYDSWSNSLPVTTAGVHMIAGLRAALEMINHVGISNLWSRSSELRDRFINLIRSDFDIIGEDSGLEKSYMISITPKEGIKWQYDPQGLRFHLERSLVSANVITINPNTTWVRLSFPYFLEIGSLNRLSTILHRATTIGKALNL